MSSKSRSFIRSRLKIRQLALLAHLDEERCVLRAAEAAGMTQPAASKLLREFEDALQEIFAVKAAPFRRPDVLNNDAPRLAESFVVPDVSLAEVAAPFRHSPWRRSRRREHAGQAALP